MFKKVKMTFLPIISELVIYCAISCLVIFIAKGAVENLSIKTIFGDYKPLDVILGKKPGWESLWPAMIGTIRLIALSQLFCLPIGICTGVYLSEFSSGRKKKIILIAVQSLSGIPSIVIGLFGFIFIVLLRRMGVNVTGSLLMSSFCLSILVLPVVISNTYSTLCSIPNDIRITINTLGISKIDGLLKVIAPLSFGGIISGIFFAAGRAAEDTAVILMTGAIASSGYVESIYHKFEALPFFIYYTSANYQNEQQLSQLFLAAFLLLLIGLVNLIIATALQKFFRKRAYQC